MQRPQLLVGDAQNPMPRRLTILTFGPIRSEHVVLEKTQAALELTAEPVVPTVPSLLDTGADLEFIFGLLQSTETTDRVCIPGDGAATPAPELLS